MKTVNTILFLLLSTNVILAQNYIEMDEYLNHLEANNKAMGTITITKNNKNVYSKSFGFTNVEANIKNKMDTKFRIGSITKTFTAVMVFQLIDEGKLSLDTPLSNFFPEIPKSNNIKISNLLNHSSGLFNITNSPDSKEWIFKSTDRKRMLARIVDHELEFKPGEQTNYSNTNYILLGFIVETLDENSYKISLQNRVSGKIGLTNTYFGGLINNDKNESSSYIMDSNTWQIQPETDLSNPGGAGAIVSTSKDLTSFIDALFGGKLTSGTSLEAMKSTNGNDEFGHGLFYSNKMGVDIYASEGGIDGFQSLLFYLPKTKNSIALVFNGLNFSKMDIMLTAFKVINGNPIVLPDF